MPGDGARGQNLEHLVKVVFLCWSFLEVYIFATTYLLKAFIVGPKVPDPTLPYPTPPHPTPPHPYPTLPYPTLPPTPYPLPYPLPYPTLPLPLPYPTLPYPTLPYPTLPYPYPYPTPPHPTPPHHTLPLPLHMQKAAFLMTWLILKWSYSREISPKHRVQRRMISVVNFFCIFQIIIFYFVVAICDLVHDV